MRSILEKYYPDTVQYYKIGEKEIPLIYTSVEREYKMLREAVGLIDGYGFGIYQVSGSQADEFLDMLSTKDIQYLNSGKVCECMFLTERAEIISAVYILNNEQSYLVFVPAENAEVAFNWMNEHKSEGVEIDDISLDYQIVWIEGYQSWKIVQELFGFPVETLALRDSAPIKFKNFALTMIRVGRSGEYGYLFLGKPDEICDLSDVLLEKYSEIGLDLCGMSSVRTCMMEVSQPDIIFEENKCASLFEMGFQWFVQFDKENYYGKDALFNVFDNGIEYKDISFVASNWEESLEGCDILLDDEKIGIVKKNTYSFQLNGILGIAKVLDSVCVSGLNIKIAKNDMIVMAKTISSPCVRPKSWDTVME